VSNDLSRAKSVRPAASPRVLTSVPNLSNLASHTAEGNPILYFTFDDGPSTYTQSVLDILAANNAHATFFVIGEHAREYPDLIRSQALTGHYVANHTFDHHTLQGITRDLFFQEIKDTEQILLNIAQDLFSLDGRVRFLRPPYGATDANTHTWATELGYAVVLWDVDTRDWSCPGTDFIVSHIMSQANAGAIILMHDGGGDRSQSVEALRTVLPQLSAQGYVFRNIFVE
jgi:peptidoglycan/xylan/chitin deacetylase (PgdA/CDA1 family)